MSPIIETYLEATGICGREDIDDLVLLFVLTRLALAKRASWVFRSILDASRPEYASFPAGKR
jgi:hypothetical protein